MLIVVNFGRFFTGEGIICEDTSGSVLLNRGNSVSYIVK